MPRSAASKLHGVLRQRAVFDVGRDPRVAPLGDPQGAAAGYDILLETGALQTTATQAMVRSVCCTRVLGDELLNHITSELAPLVMRRGGG